jgi:hypothetical protein
MPLLGILLFSGAMIVFGQRLRRDAQRRDYILMQEHPGDPFWDVAEVSFEESAGEAIMVGGAILLAGSILGSK